VSKIKKLLLKIYENQTNYQFSDFIKLIEAFGFEEKRQTGSHIQYKHKKISAAYLTIQNNKGKVKPYQAKQFLELIEKYDLEIIEK